MKKLLLSLTILLLLYSSFTTYKLCNSPEPISDTIVIPGDSVFTETTISKPTPYVVVEYNTDTIEIPADTAELARRYKDIYSRLYASKTHLDTLKNDSSATVIITTHISQNSLDSLKMQFKNNRTTSIVTNTTVEDTKWQVGVYSDLSLISTYKVYKGFSVGGMVNITDKKANIGILYNF